MVFRFARSRSKSFVSLAREACLSFGKAKKQVFPFIRRTKSFCFVRWRSKIFVLLGEASLSFFLEEKQFFRFAISE